jgi:iron complex outermembrane receptor protein
VPNLQFCTNAPLAVNNSSSQVFIRGVGQTDPTSTVDPGVGLYIDDVYIGTAVGGTMSLRDINNVQVLRGPQGTLFGRNTIGGALLLSTTDPGEEFGGTANIGGGSDSLINAFVGVDVPIAPALASRFTAGLKKQDGYVTRTDGTDLGDTNTYTLTSKFVWTPTDNLTGKFLADYTHSDENGSPLVFATINTAATFPLQAQTPAARGSTQFRHVPAVPNIPTIAAPTSRPRLSNSGAAPLQQAGLGTSLNLSYAVSDTITLKSISAYRDLEWAGNRDADNTPLTILHTVYDVKGSQWSQELQFTRQTEALTTVFGAYYFKQKSDDIATIDLNPPPPGVQRDSDNNKVDNKSWAVFTQWTLKLMDDRLGLTAGGRYTEDDKGSFPDQFDYATPTVKQVPVQWYRANFTSFTPSASVSFRITDSAMVYTSYSEGFKGGGWNSHFNAVLTPAQQAALQKFKPEEVKTVEAGFKLDLAANTVRLNGAVFTSDYKDMQITYRGPPGRRCAALTNAGNSTTA